MIYCRNCRSIWPDDAKYCGRCRGSFAGRRCKKDHLSPARALACLTCGSVDLSQMAPSFRLTWVTWVVAAILLKLFLPFTFTILGWGLALLNWVVGFVFGHTLSSLFALLITLLYIARCFDIMLGGLRKDRSLLLKAIKWALGHGGKSDLRIGKGDLLGLRKEDLFDD